MGTASRQKVLESCPIADEPLWSEHVSGFTNVFVVPAKRDRWRELLIRRPRRINNDSHKLHSDLDHRVCRPVTELPANCLRGDGVFYDFGDAPRLIAASLAADAAGGRDAIFSLVPGVLALYFFHEGEAWLCQLRATRT